MKNNIVNEALELNATHASIIDTAQITFSSELRDMCAQNSCGNYGTNWMCPPAVGELNELIEKVKHYKQGLLFQTVHQLEDSFDFEGMENAKSIHTNIFRKILENIKNEHQVKDLLALNVGACVICPKCTYPEGNKCRFPEKAVSSVEAYGIDVVALVSSCGIPYNNGKDTVSYVGLILFYDNWEVTKD